MRSRASLPLSPELLLNSPSGDLFGLTQNAGMGWDPAEAGRAPVPDSQHAGRVAGARRPPDRARVPHGPLGDRTARAGGRRGVPPARRDAVRGLLLGSVRRPDAGHGRACSTACRTATTPRSCCAGWRARCRGARGVLGIATCDKGLPAMMMAVAGLARPAGRGRSGRRDAAGQRPGRTPARCRPSARASRMAWCRSRRPRSSAAARAPRPAAAASFSGPRRRRRSWARRSACRCRTPRSRRRASRSGSTWRAGRRARCTRSAGAG